MDAEPTNMYFVGVQSRRKKKGEKKAAAAVYLRRRSFRKFREYRGAFIFTFADATSTVSLTVFIRFVCFGLTARRARRQRHGRVEERIRFCPIEIFDPFEAKENWSARQRPRKHRDCRRIVPADSFSSLCFVARARGATLHSHTRKADGARGQRRFPRSYAAPGSKPAVRRRESGEILVFFSHLFSQK